MKIQVGEIKMNKTRPFSSYQIFENRSLAYLAPCLKKYGPEFITRYNAACKMAVGLGDMIIKDTVLNYQQHLFILFDSKKATKFFIEFLDWIKDQEYFEDDYVFNNIQNSTYHMIVVKLPDECTKPLELFLQGFYSQMYPINEIEDLFGNHPDIRKILIKDHNYKIQFVGKLNNTFGTTVRVKEYDGELDFPPKGKDEYFNS